MTKARDLGIHFEGRTGPYNAITDVAGIEVGHSTIISGEGPQVAGKGPVRTGVTVILPRGKRYDPVFAAWHTLNGCGEMTGVHWVEESGYLESAIAFTNTRSIGSVYQAMPLWAATHLEFDPASMAGVFWFLPVVGETADVMLNDMSGSYVNTEHVFEALDHASPGPVQEGNVGGGAGMVCFEFKGGIGSASRNLKDEHGGYTVGVLVQSNFGLRSQLTVAGVPVGLEITDLMPEIHETRFSPPESSILAAVATDAPLLPHQLKRLAKRAPLGVGRTGGIGANTSGDIFIAFSTANPGAASRDGLSQVSVLPNALMGPLFEATIQATEEAIVNSLTSAETMTGVNDNRVYALPHDRLVEVMRKYNRM